MKFGRIFVQKVHLQSRGVLDVHKAQKCHLWAERRPKFRMDHKVKLRRA